jgi:hypothetical protein
LTIALVRAASHDRAHQNNCHYPDSSNSVFG